MVVILAMFVGLTNSSKAIALPQNCDMECTTTSLCDGTCTMCTIPEVRSDDSLAEAEAVFSSTSTRAAGALASSGPLERTPTADGAVLTIVCLANLRRHTASWFATGSSASSTRSLSSSGLFIGAASVDGRPTQTPAPNIGTANTRVMMKIVRRLFSGLSLIPSLNVLFAQKTLPSNCLVNGRSLPRIRASRLTRRHPSNGRSASRLTRDDGVFIDIAPTEMSLEKHLAALGAPRVASAA